MQKNMGTIDRVIRLLLAAVAVFLAYNGTLTGASATVALVVAGVLVLTSLVRFCPLYRLVGMSTCPIPSDKN